MREVVGAGSIGDGHDLFRAILAEVPVGVAVVRAPELVFELVNPAYQGVAPRATPGRSLAAAWPGCADQHLALVAHTVETGEPSRAEDVASNGAAAPQGGAGGRFFTLGYHPLGGDAHGGAFLLGTVTETTAHVEARRRAEAAEPRAWEVAHREEQLMAIVGHDLRTPLSAITLATELMFRRGALAGNDGVALGRIASSANRMSAIVRDLLDVARARQGLGLRVEKVPVDLAELSRRMLQDFGSIADGERVSLAVEGDPRLRADPSRLEQVLANLVGNASQHGADGPIAVRITGREAEVALSVHNFGAPIPPSILPHVFEPFRRGASAGGGADERGGSVGLGLFIVCEIVRVHGGTVEVASEPRSGTTFTVRLPRA
ncbi:MAG: sensor histidine kinase [Anaeromyxobacteraceae bacterium]